MDGSSNNTFGANPTELSDQGFMAVVIDKDTSYTYIANAMPGTSITDTRWSVRRVLTDGSDNEGTTTWANGRSSFENAADDLTSLSFA